MLSKALTNGQLRMSTGHPLKDCPLKTRPPALCPLKTRPPALAGGQAFSWQASNGLGPNAFTQLIIGLGLGLLSISYISTSLLTLTSLLTTCYPYISNRQILL